MKLRYPATQRNKVPLLDVIARVFDRGSTILEIASGSGEHGVYFTQQRPDWTWQPSDPSDEALASIAAWQQDCGHDNLCPPVQLDVTALPWELPVGPDAILCVNMIHISPWRCTEALFEGGAQMLSSGQSLVTYGPYALSGRHTSPSNAAFDESLRSRDPAWGVRDLDEVAAVAERSGFGLEERVAMPANNFTVVWRRK